MTRSVPSLIKTQTRRSLGAGPPIRSPCTACGRGSQIPKSCLEKSQGGPQREPNGSAYNDSSKRPSATFNGSTEASDERQPGSRSVDSEWPGQQVMLPDKPS